MIQKVHLIGAGGIGMSGLRIWLDKAKYDVSCSDDMAQNPNFISENDRMPDVDGVIVSSAIQTTHFQYQQAMNEKIKIVSRAAMTKKLMHGKIISVTGAHGKSTTSAMISYILTLYYPNTSFLVGAVLKNFNVSAKYDVNNEFCVVEADESDNSMNIMTGDYHLITNIEEEHINYYGTFENYCTEMRKFCDSGKSSVCHYSCKQHLSRPDVIYYGNGSNYYAINKIIDQNGSWFDIQTPSGVFYGLQISLKGDHMIDNAVGAARLLTELGLSEQQIRDGFASFQGTKRRMEEFWADNKLIIQDYANHPNDIGCVLKTIAQIHAGKSLHIAWEPHRFSRIGYKNNLERIIASFSGSDRVLLLPVWTAGEALDPAFSNEQIANAITKNGLKCMEVNEPDAIYKYIKNMMQDGDIMVAFGSGGIYSMINQVINRFSSSIIL